MVCANDTDRNKFHFDRKYNPVGLTALIIATLIQSNPVGLTALIIATLVGRPHHFLQELFLHQRSLYKDNEFLARVLFLDLTLISSIALLIQQLVFAFFTNKSYYCCYLIYDITCTYAFWFTNLENGSLFA